MWFVLASSGMLTTLRWPGPGGSYVESILPCPSGVSAEVHGSGHTSAPDTRDEDAPAHVSPARRSRRTTSEATRRLRQQIEKVQDKVDDAVGRGVDHRVFGDKEGRNADADPGATGTGA